MCKTEEKFKEQISPYLLDLMKKMKLEYGEESQEYKALFFQYCITYEKNNSSKENNTKHYEASIDEQGGELQFIERLYKRQAVIDLTLVCSSHCRYCLRQNYSLRQFTFRDIPRVVEYCKNDLYLKELLITGGDPLMVPKLLMELLHSIIEEAPNIQIIRIGTRLPVQDPFKMDSKLFDFFQDNRKKIKFEIGMQVNHVVELQEETRNVIKRLQDAGVTIYSQNVLLKNVNDNVNTLIELYDTLRYLHVEAHYLFHTIPMKGTHMFRTSISRGLDLIKELTASGQISGRIKPMYALMTDVGKVILYENTIGEKDNNGYYDVYTEYTVENRKKWNPHYILPKNARISDTGHIIVKYLDGEGDNEKK